MKTKDREIMKQRPRKRMTMHQKEALFGWVFVAPFVLGFLIFMLYPLVTSLRLSVSQLTKSTGISDMEPKSVIKKFKDKKFAAGCSREVIAKGAEMLEMELSQLVAETLEAMKQ